MAINCGIVGLPNVGKSTLFNALLGNIAAEAANYPFCTIEPNKGIVSVPDERLDILGKLNNSKQVLPTKLEFVDIAGLVKGANKGEGLGNKFLAHIREVDAIIHVLRCFDSDEIIHVEGRVNPIDDAEIVNLELIISDMNNLETRISNLEKKAKGSDKEAIEHIRVAKIAHAHLEQNLPLRSLVLNEEDSKTLKLFQMLTAKPIIYVCNVSEEDLPEGNQYSNQVKELAAKDNTIAIIISSKAEAEISALESQEEKIQFLDMLGLKESGLAQIIKASYNALDLITYFTSGPKETRGWTIKKGTKAPGAAGVIHTDFEKGFICAETTAYQDFVNAGGEQKAKETGKNRQEGKEYIVNDGDIILFRFNV
ncbi:redox-regulated ATPase YchF [Rickettsiales bacterium LUAb2]